MNAVPFPCKPWFIYLLRQSQPCNSYTCVSVALVPVSWCSSTQKKSFPTLQRVRSKVLLGPDCRVPSASHKVSADHWQLSLTCQSMSWVAGGQDEVPGESVACVSRLLAERMRCTPDRLKPRLFWIYQGDAGGCFSPGPFFGTLNSPVLAITSVLSSFAFGRQWRGDLKWHRVITTTYT